jgi:REP element-mobilizing transposase RayT
MDTAWEIFSEKLYVTNYSYDLRIHNFILMHNHYHMIVRTPRANLAKAMNYFQGETSRPIAKATDRINGIFGGPYSWSLIDSQSYYLNAYKYIYRNPLEVNLCDRVESYKYSTLRGLLGFEHTMIPIEEDETLFSDVEGTLSWMNQDYPSTEFRDSIERGLKRKHFKIPKKFNHLILPEGAARLQKCGAPSEV